MEGVGGLKSDSKAFGDYFEVGQGKKREKKGREREKIKRERKERERERERERDIFFVVQRRKEHPLQLLLKKPGGKIKKNALI
jgi:hypothetical protein